MAKIKAWCKEHKKLVTSILAGVTATVYYLTGDADAAATLQQILSILTGAM